MIKPNKINAYVEYMASKLLDATRHWCTILFARTIKVQIKPMSQFNLKAYPHEIITIIIRYINYKTAGQIIQCIRCYGMILFDAIRRHYFHDSNLDLSLSCVIYPLKIRLIWCGSIVIACSKNVRLLFNYALFCFFFLLIPSLWLCYLFFSLGGSSNKYWHFQILSFE